MGRKIPGKKHRGVKDPYAQHAQRNALLKTKINKTPVDPDEQPMPKKVRHLMAWKTKPEKTLKHKDKVTKGSGVKNIGKITKAKNVLGNNPVQKLQKLKGETKKSFNERINQALRTLKHDNPTYDDITTEDPPQKQKKQTDDDAPTEYIQKRGKKRKPKPGPGDAPVMNKSQRKTHREKEKREKAKELLRFEQSQQVRHDQVQFGEVVHAPPDLHIRPRKAQAPDTVPRPARKDLLLNSLFAGTITSKSTCGSSDLTGPRRLLPSGVRQELETARAEAVDAYRQARTKSSHESSSKKQHLSDR